MGIQSQNPSSAFKVPSNNNASSFENFQHHHNNNHHLDHNISPTLFGSYNPFGHQMLNGKVFSEQESVLTCNMSGSRTRNIQDRFQRPLENPMIHSLKISQQIMRSKLGKVGKVSDRTATASMSSGFEENNFNCLGGTSTSGPSMDSPHLVSFCSQDLSSNLLFQNLETKALIQLENEKLQVGLEEMRKRHCRVILSMLEQQVVKGLEEKETQLVNGKSRNEELEEKIKQMSAENQIWFNMAKNNEAIASGLRSNLEQAILENQNQNQIKEGFGESKGIGDDPHSSCNEGDSKAHIAEEIIRENSELKQRICCKVCYEYEISVLLLPCRHLCLCNHCESKINSCPICKSSTNASLQVFIS